MLYSSNLSLSQYIREILTTPCKSYLGMFNPKDILNSVIFVETWYKQYKSSYPSHTQHTDKQTKFHLAQQQRNRWTRRNDVSSGDQFFHNENWTFASDVRSRWTASCRSVLGRRSSESPYWRTLIAAQLVVTFDKRN